MIEHPAFPQMVSGETIRFDYFDSGRTWRRGQGKRGWNGELKFVYAEEVTNGKRFSSVGTVETSMVEPEGREHCGFSGGVEELGKQEMGVILGAKMGVWQGVSGARVAGNLLSFESFSNGVTINVE